MDLELNDRRHLEAAKGWCELHAFLEADAELDEITPALRAHPSVLEVRWQVYANLQKWEAALEIASAIVKLEPGWPSGWIYRASIPFGRDHLVRPGLRLLQPGQPGGGPGVVAPGD